MPKTRCTANHDALAVGMGSFAVLPSADGIRARPCCRNANAAAPMRAVCERNWRRDGGMERSACGELLRSCYWCSKQYSELGGRVKRGENSDRLWRTVVTSQAAEGRHNISWDPEPQTEARP